MKVTLKVLPKREWLKLSQIAHKAMFETHRPSDTDRCDYAVLFVDETDEPLGYITVKEMDAETVYWQFGGAFEPYRGSFNVYKELQNMLAQTARKYKHVHFFVLNTNSALIKLATHAGFLITGIKMVNAKTFVMFSKDLKEGM